MNAFFNYVAALPMCFVRKHTGALDSIRDIKYLKPSFKKNMTRLRVFRSDASHVKHLLYGNINCLNIKFLKLKTIIMK
jgi:hypothetical protein